MKNPSFVFNQKPVICFQTVIGVGDLEHKLNSCCRPQNSRLLHLLCQNISTQALFSFQETAAEESAELELFIQGYAGDSDFAEEEEEETAQENSENTQGTKRVVQEP